MERGYHEQFTTNEKLIIELNTGDIYEGEYSDGAKNRLDLTNVRHHNNKNALEGTYSFYRNEIISIRIMRPKETTRQVEQEIVEDTSLKVDCIKIPEEEYYRLKALCKDYVYLENADSRYYKAIKELFVAETIGVAYIGTKERNAVITLLVLSTWNQVYIFDLINVKQRQIYPELKELFECTSICKVIHKSAILVDIMYRCYNVYVYNTFDPMLVDLMIQKKERGKCPKVEKTISECLNHYLNFPLSLMEGALSVTEKKWQERPLPDKKRCYAAQLGAYLILIRDEMQKRLLKSMYEMFVNVQDLVYEKSNFEFKLYANTNEVLPEIEKLVPNLSLENNSNNNNNNKSGHESSKKSSSNGFKEGKIKSRK